MDPTALMVSIARDIQSLLQRGTPLTVRDNVALAHDADRLAQLVLERQHTAAAADVQADLLAHAVHAVCSWLESQSGYLPELARHVRHAVSFRRD